MFKNGKTVSLELMIIYNLIFFLIQTLKIPTEKKTNIFFYKVKF